MDSGIYAEGEATKPEKVWGRDRFLPTNFPDGGFFLADGYGAHTVHRYDAAGEWQSMIGSHGTEDGQFNLPHGLWIDDRKADDPLLVVADRANARVQWFDLEGKHRLTLKLNPRSSRQTWTVSEISSSCPISALASPCSMGKTK